MAKFMGFEFSRARKTDVAVDLVKAKEADMSFGGKRDLSPSEKMVFEFLQKTQSSRTTYVGVEDLGFKARQQLFYSRRARLDNLYTLAYSVTQIRTAIMNIRNEIFRRGFDEFKPAFSVKCTDPDCGKEFEDKRTACTCGKPTREPDPKQLVHFERQMKECNAFGQTLEDVLRECYDAQTEVLTKDGWKPWPDVTLNDKLATLSSVGLLEYQQPSELIKRIHRGQMVGVKTDYVDLRVTPGHGMYFRTMKTEYARWRADAAFGKNGKFSRVADWRALASATVTLPALDMNRGHAAQDVKEIPTNVFLAFLGMWLSEGSISSRYKVRENEVRITQSEEAPWFADWDQKLRSLPFNVVDEDTKGTGWDKPSRIRGRTMQGHEKTHCWAIHSTQLAEYLKQECGKGAANKRIPRWVFDLPQEQMRILFNYMMQGDGYLARNQYHSKSKGLADDVQELVLHLGYAANVRPEANDMWEVSVLTHRGVYPEVRRQDWYQQDYDGMVYCAVVPNHTLYVRRNGIACWSMNCEDDCNIADDSFLLLIKEYVFKEEVDEPVLTKIAQIVRLDPCNLEYDLDTNGIPERAHYICLLHRDDMEQARIAPSLTSSQPQAHPNYGIETSEEEKVEHKCSQCGRKMKPVMYRYLYRGRYRFYTSDEVLHWSKYSPSKTYGYPPILSIYEKAMTALGMDRWLYDYFYERIIPPGVVVTVTDDPDGLDARIKEQELKMREDPHHVAWVAVSKRTGQGKTEFVKFGSNFAEMDFQQINDRVGDAIAAQFGVSRIFMGNPGQLGGRDTSTNQLVVMSRVVESGQRIYNQKTVPRLLKAFGITDWKLELSVPDVKTEATLLEEESRRVSNAAQMNAMGFKVELAPDGKFVFSGAAVTPQEQQKMAAQSQMQMMAGMGGAPGGQPGAPGGPQGPGGAAGGPPVPDQGGGQPPPPDTQKSKHEKLPKPDDEDEGDEVELEKAYKGAGIEVHPKKPHLHRHPVKDHPGYEEEWHPIEQKHRTGEHADIQATGGEQYEKPWYLALGVTRTEKDDVEHFAKKDMVADLFPFGGGYAVRVADAKTSFQKPFPKEADARNWIQAMYTQDTINPKTEAVNLADRPQMEKPASFKGEFNLDPEVGNPMREMMDKIPPAHFAHIDGISQREQTSDVEYNFGQITLRRGIEPERAKNIVAGFIGLHAIGDALDDHFKRAQAGKERFPSVGASQGIREFRVDSYRMYVTDASQLRRMNAGIYKTLRDDVFKGVEFR